MEQLQPGGPTFGAASELREIFRRQGLGVHVEEEPLDLPRPEPESFAIDFEQRTGDEQAWPVEMRS